MTEFFSRFTLDPDAMLAWLRELPPLFVYVFLAISSIIENVFPPWPGDTVTVLGGVVMALGRVDMFLSMLSLIIGNLIGAMIMYYGGSGILAFARRLHGHMSGPRFIKGWLEEITSEESLERTHNWFERWGVYFVLISRFSAGIRFFVSIIAGISRMNLILFIVFFTLGVIIWNTVLLAGGYALGNQWHRVMEWLRVYNVIVISILTLGAAAFFYWRWRKSRGREITDAADRKDTDKTVPVKGKGEADSHE